MKRLITTLCLCLLFGVATAQNRKLSELSTTTPDASTVFYAVKAGTGYGITYGSLTTNFIDIATFSTHTNQGAGELHVTATDTGLIATAVQPADLAAYVGTNAFVTHTNAVRQFAAQEYLSIPIAMTNAFYEIIPFAGPYPEARTITNMTYWARTGTASVWVVTLQTNDTWTTWHDTNQLIMTTTIASDTTAFALPAGEIAAATVRAFTATNGYLRCHTVW